MRSTFGEREDIILLFIELIRRQLIYRPMGGCVFFSACSKEDFQ